MSQLTTRVGSLFSTDGTTPPARAGKTGEVIVGQAHGKYYEAVSRGNVYSAAVPPGTGVAPGTTLTTSGNAFVLYNPKGSGKRLKVLRTSAGYISGTLGAGCLVYACRNDPTVTAPSSGTTITPVNNDVGAANNSVAVPRFNATLDSAPTTLRPFCSMGAFVGGANNAPAVCTDDNDGEFVVEQGCSLVVTGVAGSGTSPLLTIGMEWEEIQAG
jgi:hypothetical protein